MKIIERNEDGELKPYGIELSTRIFIEEIKAGTLTIEEVPEAFREEVQSSLEPT